MFPSSYGTGAAVVLCISSFNCYQFMYAINLLRLIRAWFVLLFPSVTHFTRVTVELYLHDFFLTKLDFRSKKCFIIVVIHLYIWLFFFQYLETVFCAVQLVHEQKYLLHCCVATIIMRVLGLVPFSSLSRILYCTDDLLVAEVCTKGSAV